MILQCYRLLWHSCTFQYSIMVWICFWRSDPIWSNLSNNYPVTLNKSELLRFIPSILFSKIYISVYLIFNCSSCLSINKLWLKVRYSCDCVSLLQVVNLDRCELKDFMLSAFDCGLMYWAEGRLSEFCVCSEGGYFYIYYNYDKSKDWECFTKEIEFSTHNQFYYLSFDLGNGSSQTLFPILFILYATVYNTLKFLWVIAAHGSPWMIVKWMKSFEHEKVKIFAKKSWCLSTVLTHDASRPM